MTSNVLSALNVPSPILWMIQLVTRSPIGDEQQSRLPSANISDPQVCASSRRSVPTPRDGRETAAEHLTPFTSQIRPQAGGGKNACGVLMNP